MFCNQFSMRARWIFIYLAIIVMVIAPVSAYDNGSIPTLTPVPSPASHYYIYLDSLGNQSVGDVFFINGTTNLPPGENLTVMMVHSDNHLSSYFVSDVPIQPGKNGTNFWSCNISTTTQFHCSNEERMISSECPPSAHPVDYILDVGPEHYMAEYGPVRNQSRFYFYPDRPVFAGDSNFPTYQFPPKTKPPVPSRTKKSPLSTALAVAAIGGLFLIVFWKNGRV
jgi:hypothetical protein